MEPPSAQVEYDLMPAYARNPRPRLARMVLALFGLVGLYGLIGCGPVTSVTRIYDASVAIEAARAAQADRYAVYEFVSAVEYLKKAKEEEGYSDFQMAIDYAAKARKFADEARSRALSSPDRGLPMPGTRVEDPDEPEETGGEAL